MTNKRLKIAVYQMNSVVGDLIGNTDKLLKQIETAITNQADIFIAPELSISGYPPEDLLLRHDFYLQCQQQLLRLLAVKGITLIIGCPVHENNRNYNSVFALRDGQILGRYDKMMLPNYGVFDELRYFTPGTQPLVIEVNQVKCGLIICEDVWYKAPSQLSKDAGAEILLVINSSPFEVDKHVRRLEVVSNRVYETQLPLIYVNQVGGQDELIFDGGSFALNADSSLFYQESVFEENLTYLEYNGTKFLPAKMLEYPDSLASLYLALKMALFDYVGKNNFPSVIIGLSGGIDSALTLAIAVDALGHNRVMAIMLPSRYTADISLQDARLMAEHLQVKYEEIGIDDIFKQFEQNLSGLFYSTTVDLTEENLQARIRGTLLMALSNKFGHLVVNTSNKSEMTTGYATLYGDMVGGFALLKDVSKSLVYQLAVWRNHHGSAIIPERIIKRPPTAELRENQLDQDSLPPYAILDQIMYELMENRKSTEQIINLGFNPDDVTQIAQLLKRNEYKRRQSAVGPKVSRLSFAKDWRYPISNKFIF